MSKTPLTDQLIDNINENNFGHKSSFECAIRLCEKLEQQNAEMLAMLKKADELIDTLIIDNTVSKSINDEREQLRKLIKKVEGSADER